MSFGMRVPQFHVMPNLSPPRSFMKPPNGGPELSLRRLRFIHLRLMRECKHVSV